MINDDKNLRVLPGRDGGLTQTTEEAEDLVISMTTHAMREPDYLREKQGILAMTIEHAREDQGKIDANRRTIHKRLGPIEARMKQRTEHKEGDEQ